MNAEALLKHYERIVDAPDAVARLRRFVLDLAVRGKLVSQRRNDELNHAIGTTSSPNPPRRQKRKTEIATKKSVDVPYALPLSWVWMALGDVAEYGQPDKVNSNDELTPDSWVLDLEDIEKETSRLIQRVTSSERPFQSSKTIFRKGDVLFGKLRPYLNKVLVADTNGVCTTEIVPVRGIGMTCADYLALVLRSSLTMERIERLMYGMKMPRLGTADASELPVPVPLLAEQHRIVAKVDELMALCDRLEAARAEREATRDRLAAASLARLNTPDPDPETFKAHASFAISTALPALTTRPDQIKQLRQTILNLAVRGKLVPPDVDDEDALHVLKSLLADRKSHWEQNRKSKSATYIPSEHEEGLFTVPRSWAWASALEVCESVESGSTPPATEMYDGDGDVPFIKVYNLTKNGSLDFSVRPTFVSRSTHEGRLSRSQIRPGDVLMNIVGPPLGKVSIVPDTYSEWNTNQAVVAFRPCKVLLPKYLSICLLSDSVLSWIIDLAQQTVGQVNISVTKSRRLPIPLPPLAEQHRIVAKVDELMALCELLEASLTQGANTRSRLLDALLHEALAPANRIDEAA